MKHDNIELEKNWASEENEAKQIKEHDILWTVWQRRRYNFKNASIYW